MAPPAEAQTPSPSLFLWPPLSPTSMGNCFSDRIKVEIHHVSAASARSDTVPVTPRCEGEILQSGTLKTFTFGELATKPGTGVVIAVKRLNQEGSQGHQEWLAEVNYLGQLYHPNLVRLIGHCLEDEQRLLVYEFMPRGSLENHLFRRGSYFQPLSWSLRMSVALGAAKGLAFLHSPQVKVIYRDFKASNILLDSNYNAKLSDFGLAKDGPTGDKSHVSTRVMGTHGYAAPEYLATGHLTAKSDVYSFGVVLLEMMSGRRAVDKNRPSGEHNLVDWAKPYLTSKRKLFRVLDNRLEGQYTLDSALNVATLVLLCLSSDSRSRPTMSSVVTTLERLQEVRKDTRTLNAERRAKFQKVGNSDQNRSKDPSRQEIQSVMAAYPRPSDSSLYA